MGGIKKVADYIKCPWIVVGDFNEVLNQGEKLGGRTIIVTRCNTFSDTMNTCELIDLGFNGPKYTWTNRRKRNPIYERLDRGWGNMEWFNLFPNCSVWHLPRISSDHCRILVKTDISVNCGGTRPFRFEPMWLHHPDFKTCVEKEWRRGGDHLQDQLKHMEGVLRIWNKEVFGNLFIPDS